MGETTVQGGAGPVLEHRGPAEVMQVRSSETM